MHCCACRDEKLPQSPCNFIVDIYLLYDLITGTGVVRSVPFDSSTRAEMRTNSLQN